MKKRNLMFLTTSLTIGGTENTVYRTAVNVSGRKYSVSVCCIKGPGYYGKRLVEEGIPVTYLGMGEGTGIFTALQFPLVLLKLTRLLVKEKTDILHCYLFRANFIGGIAAKFAGVPIVINSIRGGIREKKYHFLLYRFTRRLVDMVIANSEKGRLYTIKNSGLNENRTLTIYNGIDIKNYAASKGEGIIRGELGIRKNERVVGAVGRLHWIKGHTYFIRAAAGILKKHENTKFVIVGNGGLMDSLKEEAVGLGIQGKIIFTGERNDVSGIIPVFDVFVLPSLSEGISNAVIEAMAAGKPVVATNAGGTPELVSENETGLLVEPGEPEAIADAVVKLLSDTDGARRMGEKGRGVIRERFSLTVMISRTEEVYDELLNKINKKGGLSG